MPFAMPVSLSGLRARFFIGDLSRYPAEAHYFRSVLDRFEDNVSLAAAAYNAGPLNVRRWLPRKDVMPADLWVETVPFKETRNYVQAVLAYATVFDKSLNRDTLISSRMLDIKSDY